MWLLTTTINNPHLIEQKDEAAGYRGAIQIEWLKFYSIIRSLYRNGIKHGDILKQQADHIKLLGLWLEGEWHAISKMGSTQPDRREVDGLGLSFENKLLAARQGRIANLTLGHEQAK